MKEGLRYLMPQALLNCRGLWGIIQAACIINMIFCSGTARFFDAAAVLPTFQACKKLCLPARRKISAGNRKGRGRGRRTGGSFEIPFPKKTIWYMDSKI